MVFIPSWHDNATFNQKCQSSFYATPRVVHLLHNTYKVNSAIHLQYDNANGSFFIFLCIACQGFTFIVTIHENPKKCRSGYYWCTCSSHNMKCTLLPCLVLPTFSYFSGGSSACIGSTEVNSWEGLLSQKYNSLKLSNEWLGFSDYWFPCNFLFTTKQLTENRDKCGSSTARMLN